MKMIESATIKEKVYIEKMSNGLTVIIIPKQNIRKKYVIWGTHFGSMDNQFVIPQTQEQMKLPDGVAHFLEHKMFEQKNGKNSLDVLMGLGIDANAYTTNNHTAYLFECTEHFYEGLDELMDYVQNPYFTDENVEKEKGIIGQEIKMYEDAPNWTLYMNALDCLYNENTVKLDTAGTIESISKINKEMLYKCYNTFYHPSNMVLVVCGDFEPNKLLEEIKKRLVDKEGQGEIKRIYPQKENTIHQPYKEEVKSVSTPMFIIGIKDLGMTKNDMVKRHIAIEIILNILVGKSSALYKTLYETGLIMSEPSLEYEFTEQYAHVLITGQSAQPKEIDKMLKCEIKHLKEMGIEKATFERIKKKVYGDYVVEYNTVSSIATMFLSDYFKGINSLDYIEEYETVTLEYIQTILREVFQEKNMILSVVTGKEK